MKKPLLRFEEKGEFIYCVYNHEGDVLGQIVNSRVGRFMHWVFCPEGETFYTNGCLKEIIMFITSLYSKKELNNKKKGFQVEPYSSENLEFSDVVDDRLLNIKISKEELKSNEA